MEVPVRIAVPSGDCNLYRLNEEDRRLWLERVAYSQNRYPVEFGWVDGLTKADHPVGVFLLSNVPISPEIRVLARVVGGIRWADGPDEQFYLIAVAKVDPFFAGLSGLTGLSGERHAALAKYVFERVEELGGDPGSLRWLTPAEAERAWRERRRQTRLRQATDSGRRIIAPAWKTVELRSGAWLGHTAAEYQVPKLPQRFQEYVEECLLPEERILFVVPRPAIRRRGGLLRWWGSRWYKEGVLIVTDQQLLFMEDVVPPDYSLVHWGYVASAMALERLRAVRLGPAGRLWRLEIGLDLQIAGGESHYFEADALPALEAVSAYLERWLPPDPAAERLQRRSSFPTAAAMPSEDFPEDWSRIEELTTMAYPDGPPAQLLRAYAPAEPAAGVPEQLLLLTPQEITLLETTRGARRPAMARTPVAEVTRLGLRSSHLGCFLAWATRSADPAGKIRFQLPRLPAFRQAFLALRQLTRSPWTDPLPAPPAEVMVGATA